MEQLNTKNKNKISQKQYGFNYLINSEYKPFYKNHKFNDYVYIFSTDSLISPIIFSSVSNKSKENTKKTNNLIRIQNFSEYKKNWNGYDAKPITKTIIKKADNFINIIEKQPKVFPTSRSTIQFEWDSIKNKYLEIEIFSNHYSILKIYNEKQIEFETNKINDCMEAIDEYFR